MSIQKTPTVLRPARADGRVLLAVSAGGTAPGPQAWALRQTQQWDQTAVVVTNQGVDGDTHAGQAVARLAKAGTSASALTAVDPPAIGILALLGTSDEVVVAAQGVDSPGGALGAHIADQLLRHAPGPVVVVPELWQATIGTQPRVVVAYDNTREGDAAVVWALDECARTGGRLEVIRAATSLIPSQDDEELDEADVRDHVEALAAPRGVTDIVVLAADGTTGALAALTLAAEGAHALVIGNRRTGWLAGGSGFSVTAHAALHAPCPVVAVPEDTTIDLTPRLA